MGSEGRSYEILIKSVETVAAALLVKEHRLALSNFDLLLPPLDVGVLLCFTKPATYDASVGPTNFPSMVAALKAALAKVLVIYYPLAGEMVTNSAGEPEILCNNRGVDLIEAYANVELRDVNFYNPDDYMEDKFVPKKKGGLLSIQVTELRCGGVAVGCQFDHRVADAYAFNMFMLAWANIALGEPIQRMPFFSSSLHSPHLLFPSNPPDPLFDRLFVPLSLYPPPDPSIPLNSLINRMYRISAFDIARIQEMAGGNHSKMVSFTAYLWQMLARSVLKEEESCSMGMVVDGRPRMKNSYGIKFMKNYFGNVLSLPFGNLRTETLLGMKLVEVANEVRAWLTPAIAEDHFLGLLDWVEAHRPEPSAARIYLDDSNDKGEKSVACVVSSGRGFPEVDFGFGKAVFGSYHFAWGGNTGYVMPIPQPTGDWVVYAHVKPSVVAVMEEEPMVFRKLTVEYFVGTDKSLCK